jgi:hypothetical protein
VSSTGEDIESAIEFACLVQGMTFGIVVTTSGKIVKRMNQGMLYEVTR